MSTLRDYIDNPDSVPNDPEAVAQILAEVESDSPDRDAQAKPEATEDKTETQAEGDEGQPEGKAEAKPEGQTETDPKPEGDTSKGENPVIKAKDGKHELPYSVLESERRRSRELQQQLAEAQARLEEIEAAKQSGAPVADPAPTDIGADDMEEAIKRIEEEYGEDHELAKPLRAQQSKLRDMEARLAKLDELDSWRKQQEQKAAQTAVSEVDEAIDSIPVLAGWRAEQGPLWDAAVAVDARLMKDPEHAGKSLKERFEAVVRLMGHDPNPKTDPPNLEKVVDEKLAAQERQRPPASLSDLPGGATFAQSEHESLENMPVTELAAKFDKMTPDQREAFLAGL